jgi:hypothetical protein
MKRLFNALLAAFALVASSGASFAAQSYPMQCRGGGTIGLVTATKSAVMYFGRAPNRAADGLGVGQCAWLDRAIGTGEPSCLQQSNVNAVAWITGNNLPSSQALTSTHFQPNEPRVQWMRSLLSSASYQTFYAYNPGNGGCFVVTAP